MSRTERARLERVDARTDNLQVIIDAAQHEAVTRERARARRIVKTAPITTWSKDYLLAALRGKGTR